MSEADKPTGLKYLRQLMRKRKPKDQENSKNSGDQLVSSPASSPKVASSAKFDTPALEGLPRIGSRGETTSPGREEAVDSELRMGRSENSVPPALVGDKANETQKSSLRSKTMSTTGDWAPSIDPLGTGSGATVLWELAYDLLQHRYGALLDIYEKIVIKYLTEKDAGYESENNRSFMLIFSREDTRRRQMDLVIQSWLSEQESGKHGNGDLIAETSRSLRDILRSSLERSSDVSLPWAAACIAAEGAFLRESASDANRSGIIEVISKMEWYHNLSRLVLDQNIDDQPDSSSNHLKEKIIGLYEVILLFLIQQSVATAGQNYWREPFGCNSSTRQLIVEREEALIRELTGSELQSRLHQLLHKVKSAKGTLRIDAEISETDKERLTALKIKLQPIERPLSGTKSEKGHILPPLYEWATSTEEYRSFFSREPSGLHANSVLQVTGPSGYGKTMLMRATVQGLLEEKSTMSATEQFHIAYFFCDSLDQPHGYVTEIIKSLVWQILKSQPSLVSHMEHKFKSINRDSFNDPNDFCAISTVFYSMIGDGHNDSSKFGLTYIIVDGIEELHANDDPESATAVDNLIRFINKTTQMSSHIKWLVSVGPKQLFNADDTGTMTVQSVTLNIGDERYSEELINNVMKPYISVKVAELAHEKGFNKSLQRQVCDRLWETTPRSFLWVKMVCHHIRSNNLPWNATRILGQLPVDDTEKLYHEAYAAFTTVDPTKDRDTEKDQKMCRDILTTAAIAHRTLRKQEMENLVNLPAHVDFDIVVSKMCFVFLGFYNDHVCYVHPSARNFIRQTLDGGTVSSKHLEMVQQCLKRAIVRNRPKSDTYAITNWMRHFCGISSDEDLEMAIMEIERFLDNHFLLWADDLATHGLLSEAAILLQRVNTFLKNKISRPYTQPQDDCLVNIQQALWLLNFRHSASPQKELSPKYSLPFLPSGSKLRLNLLEKAFPWLEMAPNVCSDFAQSGTLLNGHLIGCCCYSPDGRMIATGGYDGVVRIWDVETFKVQQAFTTSSFVRQVLFIKNHLLIALSGLTIYIWDKCAGKLLKALPTSGPCFGFSTKHNQLIATQGEELTLISFPSHRTGDWISSTALSIGKDSISGVKTMSISPDGELMAYTKDSRIFIWNIESKKIHRLFNEHTSGINGLAWRGSKYLASASEDKTVRIWATGNDSEENSEEGQVANSLCVLAGHSGNVTCVSFSSDGSRLASGSSDRTIRIWILKESDQTQYELWKVLFGHSEPIFSLDFDPYRQQLISSSSDMTVRVWAISTIEKADADQEEPRQPPSPSPLRGHSLAIILIVFSPDGRLFASASFDGKICLWDCVEGNIIGSFEEHTMHITSLSFSDSGKILVSTCKDRTARVWDTDTMTIKYRLWGHDDWVNCAVVSPNETLVASASDDMSVRVWELSSLPAARAENNYSVDTKHRRFGGHDGHEDCVSTVAFSPKGGYLASGDDDSKILIWNLQGTGDQTKPEISIDNASKKSIRALCFTEDEKRIASCDARGVIKILNLETKVCEHILASEGKPQIFNSIKFIKAHPNLLMTDLGVWKIPKKAIPPSISACKPNGPVKTALSRKSAPDWCPYGIKRNQEWITWKNKDLIFLPAQFRPSKYEEAACCIQGRKVVIGCESGQVLFFRFSEKGPYLSRSDSL